MAAWRVSRAIACFQPSSLFHAEFELGPAQACTAIEEARGRTRAGRASCARNARACIESERLARGRQACMNVADLNTKRVDGPSNSQELPSARPTARGRDFSPRTVTRNAPQQRGGAARTVVEAPVLSLFPRAGHCLRVAGRGLPETRLSVRALQALAGFLCAASRLSRCGDPRLASVSCLPALPLLCL